MKINIAGLFLLITVLVSCNNKKEYKYVEIIEEVSVFGTTDIKEKDEVLINAINDSTAYLEAYKTFSISKKINNDMKLSLGKTFITPLNFKLYNDKGVEITNTTLFANKEKREKEIENKIFSMKNTIQESVDRNKEESINKFKKTAKIDSIKIKKLVKYFRIKSDEFSNENKKWYEPKSAPNYTNRNGLYCYFHTENEIPSNLRFRFQYFSDDWLFIEKIQFSIDGKAFEYTPIKTETDSGDGDIWEWFDQSVSESDKQLLNALANAKSAKMKLIGSQYFDIKYVSREQIIGIKRTLDLYIAMGGEY